MSLRQRLGFGFDSIRCFGCLMFARIDLIVLFPLVSVRLLQLVDYLQASSQLLFRLLRLLLVMTFKNSPGFARASSFLTVYTAPVHCTVAYNVWSCSPLGLLQGTAVRPEQ